MTLFILLKISNERKYIPKNENIDLKEIGKRIKVIRKNLGFSLRNLGDELNAAFSSLASYECGEHLIQSETLIALAKLSNTSIDYILNRD